MKGKTLRLSVLLLKEGESWVAQCLEHDIAAQGKTANDAKHALEKTIAGQGFLDLKSGVSPIVNIKPAPDYYRNLFDKAEKMKHTFRVQFSENDDVSASADDVRVVLA